MSSKAISLVLGSGGARGLAHVGVIRWLEELIPEVEEAKSPWQQKMDDFLESMRFSKSQVNRPMGYVVHSRSIVQYDAECYCTYKNGR